MNTLPFASLTGNKPQRNFRAGPKPKSQYEKKNRTSLRIGTTSKRGRSAAKNRSRGSLKKRDRSHAKMIREQNAIERNTIELPE